MLEEQIENWIKQMNKVLEENVDVMDESWFKQIYDSRAHLKDCLDILGNL